MLSSATFPLNVRIILSDPFSDGSSFYVACVCIHCRWTDHNCSTMSLTSPVYCLSDAFSSYRVSFYLIYWNWHHLKNYICSMMSLTIMDLDPGPLLRALFHFALDNLLVVLVNQLVVFVT